MPMDIALTGLALPIGEFPAIAREAETRGYRTAWVGEASGAEAIVLSTLIATHTTTLKIANGVIPVQTRTPIVYGQAAATLGSCTRPRGVLSNRPLTELVVRVALDDDRDVIRALADPSSATTRPRAEALGRRTFVGPGRRNEQLVARDVIVVLGVGHR